MRLVVIAASLLCLAACPAPPPRGEDGGDERTEGEGEEGEGEGEGEEGEGEGEEGEGEGEGEIVDGPDLTLGALPIMLTADVIYVEHASDACEVTEALVAAPGARALLQLDLTLSNLGTRALTSAFPEAPCGFTGDDGLVAWRLLDATSAVIATGTLAPRAGTLGAGQSVTFHTQGASLIDVTDVPAGDYVLELEVDPDNLVAETDESNNLVSSRVPLVNSTCGGVVCGGDCCASDACVDGECRLPNLFVDSEILFQTLDVQETYFGEESCAVFEGCVEGTGDRRLLRFSTTTPNDGTEDLVMGPPSQSPLFSYSQCHEHYHFDQYAAYRLLTLDGDVAAVGHKQAFCLIDLERRDDDASPIPQYNCGDQGISRGWADTYSSELDCQWVDITGLPEGDYVLEVHVNPERIFAEMDHSDNIARVPVFIPADPNACIPTAEVCGNGEDEDCDDVPDNGCAPLSDNHTCDSGLNVDGSALFLGAIAQTNASSVSPSCGGEGGDLFFHFNVPTPGLMYLSTYGSELDTTLSVFRNNACASDDEVLCLDDGCGDPLGGAHFVGEMAAGAYTAVVKAKQVDATGLVRLKIQQAGCANVDAIEDVVSGNTSDAVNNTAPTCGDGGGNGPDEQWYFTTCPGAHDIALSTCNDTTGFDSLLEVRAGGCLGDPVLGACNDDRESGEIVCSDVNVSLEGSGAGDGLWFVLIDGYRAQSAGPYDLSLAIE